MSVFAIPCTNLVNVPENTLIGSITDSGLSQALTISQVKSMLDVDSTISGVAYSSDGYLVVFDGSGGNKIKYQSHVYVSGNTLVCSSGNYNLSLSNNGQYGVVQSNNNLYFIVPQNGNQVYFRTALGNTTSYLSHVEGWFSTAYSDISNSAFSLSASLASLNFRNNGTIRWSNDGNHYGAKSAGIRCNSSGVIEINNGNTSGYANLYLKEARYYNSSGTTYSTVSQSGMQSSYGDLCLLNPNGYGIKISTDIPGGSGPLIRPSAGSKLFLHGSPSANGGQCMSITWNGGRTDIAALSGGFRGYFDGGVTIGDSSTVINRVKTGTATLDFPSISGNSHQELTITVTGAATGDCVILGIPSTIESGLIANGYVSSTNTVTVRLANITTSPIDPASATWRATIMNL